MGCNHHIHPETESPKKVSTALRRDLLKPDQLAEGTKILTNRPDRPFCSNFTTPDTFA
jgi:hypothetical protein